MHQFYKATLQDPLFAAEGMDLERGIAALERIEGQCTEMQRIVSADSWKRRLFLTRYPIAKYALPLTFLRAFIQSERERRVFLSHPTIGSATRLLLSWKNAQRAYAADLRRYRFLHETLMRLEKKTDSFQFEDFAMNITSLADVKKVLALFEKNAEILGKEVALRDALLTNGTPYRTSRYVSKISAYKPTTISVRHQYLIDLELQHGAPFRDNKVVETFGPLAYTLDHFDKVPTEHAFYAFIVQEASSQARFLKISLADQFYFLDLTKLKDERNWGLQTLHAPSIKRGISHWFQSVTHGYASRDQLYVADMATVIDLRRRPSLPVEQVSLQRSSMLDLILMGGSFDLDTVIQNTKDRARAGLSKGYSYLDMLLIRTHPSVFYLPFNASVWRLDEMPNFLGSKKRDGEPKYKTLDMIEESLPSGMIELIMQGGRIRDEARKALEARLGALG